VGGGTYTGGKEQQALDAGMQGEKEKEPGAFPPKRKGEMLIGWRQNNWAPRKK